MKNKAFTYMEIVISLFILTLTLIPALKLNSNQIKNYKLITDYDKEKIFFTSLLSYLKANKIFFEEDISYTIKNFSELKTNILFKQINFSNEIKGNFLLEIKIRRVLVNFYSKQLVANIYKISFQRQKKKYQLKLIKFKE